MIVILDSIKLPLDVDLIYVSTNYIWDFSDLETCEFLQNESSDLQIILIKLFEI